MAYEVKMPQLGLTMEEGTVSRWLVKEGDAVRKGQPLLELTTDKLTNEIQSEYEGTVLKLLAREGEDYPVKALLAYIGQPGERVDTASPAAAAAEPAPSAAAAPAPANRTSGERLRISPLARRTARELGVDCTSLRGSGPMGRIIQRDVQAAAAAAAADKPRSSPLAKKLAEDLSIDLAQVGGRGRILAEDILAYLKTSRPAEAEAPQEERVPMDGMRRAIAKNMQASHMTSPTVNYALSVDMSAVKACREQLKAKEIKLSYTDFLIKIVARALTEFPLLNCSVEENSIVFKRQINIGVAVALDKGLLVPNIRDADKKTLTGISAELKELSRLAREGGLPMEKLHGGTFTVTNLGMYGIESFTPIINQPEVAILGVTAMEDRVVVRGGEMVIRPMMNLCLTADHRVIDGAVAAQFMQRLKDLLETPALLLA